MSNGNNTSGVPVESAMPDAATPAEDQPNLQTAIGAMVEYPEGRGGMGIVSMPGGLDRYDTGAAVPYRPAARADQHGCCGTARPFDILTGGTGAPESLRRLIRSIVEAAPRT